jgi:hypothetical protein
MAAKVKKTKVQEKSKKVVEAKSMAKSNGTQTKPQVTETPRVVNRISPHVL